MIHTYINTVVMQINNNNCIPGTYKYALVLYQPGYN